MTEHVMVFSSFICSAYVCSSLDYDRTRQGTL